MFTYPTPLLLLSLLHAVTANTASSCIVWYCPANNPAPRDLVAFYGTWREADLQCGDKYFGHNLLQHGYSRVVGLEAPDCGNQQLAVPLGLTRTGYSSAAWVNGHGIGRENVGPDDLQYIDSPALINSGLLGMLNLSNNLWSFAEENREFGCAYCEVLRRKDLRKPFQDISSNFYDGKSRYHVKTTSRGEIADSVNKKLASALEIEENDIEQVFPFDVPAAVAVTLEALSAFTDSSSSTTDSTEATTITTVPTTTVPTTTVPTTPVSTTPDTTVDVTSTSPATSTTPTTSGSTQTTGSSSTIESALDEFYFRLTVLSIRGELPPASEIVMDSVTVAYISNIGVCPAEKTTDVNGTTFNWPATKQGEVVIRRKNGSLLLTARECILLIGREPNRGMKIDSDFPWPEGTKANWTDPTVWVEEWVPCPANNNTNETPEETLDEAEDLLEDLADSPVLSKQLDQIADLMNGVLKLDSSVLATNSNKTNNIAKNLETILADMILEPGLDVVKSVRSDLVVVVSDVLGEYPVVGISLSDDGGQLPILQTIRQNESEVLDEHTQVFTHLPMSLVSLNSRLAFTVYPNGKLFPTGSVSRVKVNSHVVNVVLVSGDESETIFPEGEYVDIIFRPVVGDSDKKFCSYWNFTTEMWATDGCLLMNFSDSFDTCRCTHLTNFAEIITGGNGNNISDADKKALDIISLIGCSISLLALIGIAMTAFCFEHWRKELSNKILLHMSGAIALNLFAFLLIASVETDLNSTSCIVFGVLLHYSVLACLSWMLVMSGLQLLRLLTILGYKGISHLLLKISLIAWGTPFFPVMILLAINPHIYTSYSETVDRNFCYPDGTAFYLTVLTPISLIMIANITVFVVILMRLYSWCGWGTTDGLERHGITDRTVAIRRMRMMVFLFFLFGLTWTFGLFARHVVFAYLFCIAATSQGCVLFVFLIVLERKATGYWKAAMQESLQRSSEQSTDVSKISESFSMGSQRSESDA